jgi:hypothetical protein
MKATRWPQSVFLLILAFAGASTALAAAEDVRYDFANKTLTVYGFFSPKQGEKKEGLAAEISARAGAVATLSQALSKECTGPLQTLQPGANWQRALRSQGSEIYANGVLKIILTASLREVFKPHGSHKSKLAKTPQGETLVFELPLLPAGIVQCGTVGLNFDGKTLRASPVAVESSEKLRIVKLLLATDKSLAVASPDDVDALKAAGFSESVSDGLVALPIAPK